MSRPISSIRAVLFDLDGTLVDTAPDLVGCVQEVMRARGLRTPPFETLRCHVSRGVRGLFSAAFGAAFVESSEYPQVQEQCLNLYSTRLAERSRLFPGMRRVLDELARRGIRWGVVTNKPEHLARPLLKALNLADECAVTVGGGTTEHNKPHPEPMLYAARHLALENAECIMLGDDPRDMQAATAAGMASLAAAWGYFPPDEDLSTWGAAAVLGTPENLLDWLDQQGGAADAGARPPRAA